MSSLIYFENRVLFNSDVFGLKKNISTQYGIPIEDLYFTLNGKPVYDDTAVRTSDSVVRVWSRLVGGKGGFGTMLRAVGAPIEKTTNQEARRDHSDSRLRDIKEDEKWVEGQENQGREAAEKKQKKLERLIAKLKIDVNMQPQHEKERQQLPERVSMAVEADWQAAGPSNVSVKRKAEEDEFKGKKRAKLWVDAEISDCSSFSEDEEEFKSFTAHTVSTDSGNESDKCPDSSKI